jgi:hypothetical protein
VVAAFSFLPTAAAPWSRFSFEKRSLPYEPLPLRRGPFEVKELTYPNTPFRKPSIFKFVFGALPDVSRVTQRCFF